MVDLICWYLSVGVASDRQRSTLSCSEMNKDDYDACCSVAIMTIDGDLQDNFIGCLWNEDFRYPHLRFLGL